MNSDNPRIKIIIESNIPFIAGLLEPYADVIYLPSDAIDAKAVKDADALIVRTRTRCDAALLEKSACRLIVTATIGTDHIDMPWCKANGITVVNCPGCNAPGVAQYVMASIIQLANRKLQQYTLGIVGVGHVGSIIERWARALDMNVIVCDPPRQATEGGDKWSTLDEIAVKADIITFHTPLTREGENATYHIANEQFFDKLKRRPIIVNSARGGVVDTPALIAALDAHQVSEAVIDCWEGEPNLSLDLLKHAAIATPHIAGYSYEGKVRATQMALDAVTTFFYLPRVTVNVDADLSVAQHVTPMSVIRSYNPLVDTERLKKAPEDFEKLRNEYHYRSEVPSGVID